MIINFLIILFLGSNSIATTDAFGERDILCRNGKVVRTLSFKPKIKNNQCSTIYNKNGRDKEISRGQSPTACKGVFDQVKSTLEKAHWNCKDITNLQISEK